MIWSSQPFAADRMAAGLGPILIAVGGVASLVGPAVIGAEPIRFMVQENSPVEIASATLWFVLAASIAVYAAGADRALMVLAILAVAAGAREMDAHYMFTTRSISQSSYWVDATVPPGEKLVAGAVLLVLASTAIYGLARYGKSLLSALRAGNPAAWSLATLILAVPAIKVVDLLPHYVPGPRGTEQGAPYLILAAAAFEEMTELLMPVIGVLALGQYSEHRRRSRR
jgi:hypothetical protein